MRAVFRVHTAPLHAVKASGKTPRDTCDGFYEITQRGIESMGGFDVLTEEDPPI
jgi:hypothetical protein